MGLAGRGNRDTIARAALNGQTGIVSYWARAAGLVEQPVLQSHGAVLVAAMLAGAWRSTPLVALFLLAGLSTIPSSVRDAALVDGAGAAQRFLLVTLPLLRPALLVVLLFRVLDALRVFDLFYVLGGQKLRSLSTYVFTKVLRSTLFIGVGMAASVFVYALALLVALGFLALLLRGQEGTDAADSGQDGVSLVGVRPAGGAAFAVVAAALVASLAPLLYVLKTSLSTVADLSATPPSILPRGLSPDSYVGLLADPAVTKSLFNSLVIAGSTTLLVLLLASPAAYAAARSAIGGGSQLLLAAVLAVAFFPQVSVLTPLFVQLRALGLANTYWAAIIPNTGFLLPLAVWFLASFLRAVPREIEEAARVDGASAPQVLARITLPLAAPGVLAVGALVFVLAWNEFVFARTLIFDLGTQPVTALLGDFVASLNVAQAYGLAAAGAVVATLVPVALILVSGRFVARGLLGGPERRRRLRACAIRGSVCCRGIRRTFFDRIFQAGPNSSRKPGSAYASAAPNCAVGGCFPDVRVVCGCERREQRLDAREGPGVRHSSSDRPADVMRLSLRLLAGASVRGLFGSLLRRPARHHAAVPLRSGAPTSCRCCRISL